MNLKSEVFLNKKITFVLYDKNRWTPIKIDSFLLNNGHHILNGEVRQPTNLASLSLVHNGKRLSADFVLDSGINNVDAILLKSGHNLLGLQSTARGSFIFKNLDSVFMKVVSGWPGAIGADERIKTTPELYQQVRLAQLEQLSRFPNDFAALLYLYNITHSDATINSAKKYLLSCSGFNAETQKTQLGMLIFSEQTRLIQNKEKATAGHLVPIFKVSNIDNKFFSNSSLQGQPYIIVFSATWCGPCQKQLPRLKTIYNSYLGSGLKVVYFNDDDNVKRWKEHVKKNGLNWINVSEKLKPAISKVPKSFGVYAIPSCFVIDRNGVIIYNSDDSDEGLRDLEIFVKKAVSG